MWEGVGWGWALINFAAFRMGAYSRWALIRGWALIRRNAVFNLSVEHFWRSLLISRNGFGSTNFSTAFRLRNFFFFLFLSFVLSLSFSIVFFRLIFRFSPQSHSPLPSPAVPPLLQTRRNDHFVLVQTITSTIPPSWLTQKVRAALWPERLH